MSNTYDQFDEAVCNQRNTDPARDSGKAVVCPRCGYALPVRRGDLWPAWLPDPREEPTVPVWPVVGRLLGRKRSAILELARRDRLPVQVLRVGRSYRVATAELVRVLGLQGSGELVNEPFSVVERLC